MESILSGIAGVVVYIDDVLVTGKLKSHLGLLTYYSRFLPNLSLELAPLYKLLKHNEPWHWTSRQKKAFERSKELLLSSQLLVHFHPNLEIHLACDASSYGIGAVLSHKMPDGSEKPVGFISRTLTDAEKKYSQIEKEGLACVYGVTHFHSYLFGHHFKLQTDHKPLLTLFNESKAVSPQASRQDLTLGVDPSVVRIYNCAPNNNTTCECRCYEQVATPGHSRPDTCFRRASADGGKIGGCPHLSSTDSNMDTMISLVVKSALLQQGRIAG